MGSLTNQWSESIQQNQRYCHYYSLHILPSFQNLVPTLPTMPWVTSLETSNQMKRNLISRHKRLYSIIFRNAVVRPKTCQRTQMCKIAGVTFLRWLISCFPLQEKKIRIRCQHFPGYSHRIPIAWLNPVSRSRLQRQIVSPLRFMGKELFLLLVHDLHVFHHAY